MCKEYDPRKWDPDKVDSYLRDLEAERKGQLLYLKICGIPAIIVVIILLLLGVRP